MTHRLVRIVLLAAMSGSALTLHAQGNVGAPPPATAQAAAQTVPADLKPLLTPHHSDMRLVMTRYTQDRNLLIQNYAGTGGGGRGRGGAAADTTLGPPITISPARIARLKRFDMDWAAALGKIDVSKLTADSRPDLDSLKALVQRNQTSLESETTALSDVSPLIPFSPELVTMIEARLQLHDVDAQASAGVLTNVTKEITALQSQIRSGAVQPNRLQALRAAGAVDALRNNLGQWFAFYNGFDPLFTWWMGLPNKHITASLTAYSSFLRDSIAPANRATNLKSTPMTIAAVAAPKLNEVPDLGEIIALKQDEMTDIVALFLGRGARGAGAGPGGVNGAPAAPVRDSAYYQSWLTALKTLDFDHLTRNAQVDYLYMKKMAERRMERVGHPLPTNPPRLADNSGITGAARGREGLIRDLQDQLIPYTPEQLLVLAEREMAWTRNEMIKASRQMGYGDDWKAALEKTKTMTVPPGQQPAMVRDLVFEGRDYVMAHNLVTVPQVASESLRMTMLSPQAQLTSPFFLGGSLIQVAYPTDSMEYDARLQAMRGNNRAWSHATAFHEMIPGHNLSDYYNARYATYRANLGAGGPFYVEGWALYWELTLYDMGFDSKPEEKVGAMFWRMHRCARIIFSLKFHMGQWTPQQAVDFLVDSVGHERDNATAEVRRSFAGNYEPLYQAGYLLGGLQLRSLHHDLVDSKQMTNPAFHDEILRQGSMPIGLLRLALSKKPLTRDMDIDWAFYGDLPQK